MKAPSDRTLSDVVARGRVETPDGAPLPSEAWFPNGTRTTIGLWLKPSLGRTHFFAAESFRPICRRKVCGAGEVVREPIASTADFCVRCLSSLRRAAEREAKPVKS